MEVFSTRKVFSYSKIINSERYDYEQSKFPENQIIT